MDRSIFSVKKGVLVLAILFIVLSCSNLLAYAEWTVVSLPVVSRQWDLQDVYFISVNEGWIVGSMDTYLENGMANYRGILLHYENGSWTDIKFPYPSVSWWLSGIHFISSNEGWAVGGDGQQGGKGGILLHYLNGSWTVSSPPDLGTGSWMLNKVRFTSSDEGWAVGWGVVPNRTGEYQGILFHYHNGSWAVIDLPYHIGYPYKWNLQDIYFVSPNEGWIVGGDTQNNRGILFHYSNGSWTRVEIPVMPDDPFRWWVLSGVYFVSPNEGWVVGSFNRVGSSDILYREGILLHYNNGSWTLASTPPLSTRWALNDVYFTSANEGWAIGKDWSNENEEKGVILHYSDGAWTSTAPPSVSPNWELYRINFVSPTEGWAVGGDSINMDGVLLKFFSTSTDVFSDVPSGYWAYDYIMAIYYAHITVGCTQNPLNYCPEADVTRGQMAAFITRAKYGETFSYTTTPYFTDVPSTHTFFKYVQKLRDDGITVVSGTYGVDTYVTRGQMAAFIIRAKFGENFSYTTTPYFNDVPSTHTFFKYVQKLKDVGITAVTGTYNVDDIVSRAQMAAFLARAFLGMQ